MPEPVSYVKKLYGAGFVAVGAFFLIEHIYNFGFELFDFFGHEWLGVVLIIIGIIIAKVNTGFLGKKQ